MEQLAKSNRSKDLGQVLRRTIQKHQMLGPADRVLTGVSGGADSVCLALCLKDIGYEIGIAHVNHGLRGADSDEDERFTSALAQQLEVPYFSRRVVLLSGNIEAAGREARRDFFAEIADRYGFARIA